MSFLKELQSANQDMVSTNREVYLMAKPKASDNLETILTWVKAEGERIEKDFNSFKSHVQLLMSENREFYNWAIATKQNMIAIECGISQGYTSKIFGPIQQDHKSKINKEIEKQITQGIKPAQIARDFGCSTRKIQQMAQKYSRNNFAQDRNLTDENPLSTLKEAKVISRTTVFEREAIDTQGKSIKELQEDIMALEFQIRQKDRELAERDETIEQLQQELEHIKLRDKN